MPYYCHDRGLTDPDCIIRTGRSHTAKSDAIADRKDAEQITFVATLVEKWDWRDREAQRMRDGTYTATPWAGRLHRGLTDYHYAHMSRMDGGSGKIAYTPDDTFGHEDRQLSTTPARYLAKFFPDLSTAEVAHYTGTARAADKTLQFARTPDEIVAVYMTPARHFTSCMDGRNFPDAETHPARSYGDSDLWLAYIGTAGVEIHARALVWDARKVYCRSYGQQGEIDSLLKNAGYTQSSDGGFAGAKIRAEKRGYNHRYTCPYVDWHGSADLVRVNGRHYFEIRDDESGEYWIQNTDGLARENESQETYTCERDGCDNDRNEEETFCEDCQNDSYTCESCNETYFDSDDSGTSHRHGVLCPSCDEDHTRTCEHCEDTWNLYDTRRSERRFIESNPLCPDCTESGVVQCPDCDEWTDHTIETFGRDVCHDCRTATLRAAGPKRRPRGTVLRVWRVSVQDSGVAAEVIVSVRYA